jgi:hypothetical protein
MNRTDLENLSDKELLKIQKEISEALIRILNKTEKESNEILEKYGLKCQIVFELKEK